MQTHESHDIICEKWYINTNPTKWSNTLNHSSAKADGLSVFDHFVGLVFNPIQDGPFRGHSQMGGYPTMMKLDTVIH